MKVKVASTILIIICALGSYGCGVHWAQQAAIKQEAAFKEYDKKNPQIALGIGQKTYSISRKLLAKAIIQTLANRGLKVLTADYDFGVIVAEGNTFLSHNKFLDVMRNHIKNNKQTVIGPEGNPSAGFPYGGYKLTVSVNIYDKEEEKSLAKVNFSAKQKTQYIGLYGTRHYDIIPSDLLVAYYQNFWADVDKSIFMQRETILN